VAAGALAVLLLGLLTYLTTRRGRDAAAWVGHTYEVLASLEAAQGRAVDAETGVRGYVATGVPRFLDPYQRADRDVARELARLRRLTADNAVQAPRLDTLEARLGRAFAHLDSAVALRRARRAGRPRRPRCSTPARCAWTPCARRRRPSAPRSAGCSPSGRPRTRGCGP
jgi:CHASE3 domain sensor protein